MKVDKTIFDGLEKELRGISNICRLVKSVCGHLDCEYSIIQDCLLIEDITNFGKEDFGHITLPKKRLQVEAVQRLLYCSRAALTVIKYETFLTFQDINSVSERVSDILSKYRKIKGDEVTLEYDDDNKKIKNTLETEEFI
jgi:hypothetical protein